MNAVSSDTLSSLGITQAGKKDKQVAEEAGAKKEKLGQADFLTMMTEQLKNQDPLNPMENGAFLAQLAQFSTVQGLGDLNKKADQFLGSMDSDQAMRGAALIGHKVAVPGSTLSLAAEGGGSGAIQVNAKGPINVVVQDANGVPVRSLSLADGAPGSRPFEWDGKDNAGNRLPAGDYKFAATQAGADGKPVALDTYTDATVESVSLGKQGATLNLSGAQTVQLKDVLRIS